MNTNYVVGQEIAFRAGYGKGRWEIARIERITKSGRLICGNKTLNSDLSIRGASVWGPYCGTIVTKEIREEYEHQRLSIYFQNLKFHEFDLETLKKLNFIIQETKQ